VREKERERGGIEHGKLAFKFARVRANQGHENVYTSIFHGRWNSGGGDGGGEGGGWDRRSARCLFAGCTRALTDEHNQAQLFQILLLNAFSSKLRARARARAPAIEPREGPAAEKCMRE